MGTWWDEFKENVKDVYFPFGQMDLKRDNVLGAIVDGEERYYITDPIWNSDDDYYEPIPEPIEHLWVYPQPKKLDLNILKENITHGRVW